MAGPASKSLAIGDSYLQVTWIDYDASNRPRYQWMLRDEDIVAVDGGLDLTLEAGENPNATKAMLSLIDGLRKAGRAFDYERISGERKDFRDDFSEATAMWAFNNDMELLKATVELQTSVSLER